MNLGARIKKLRLNNNLSVRKLAEKVGVTASFIYQLEQNKVSPSFSTLKSIANKLHTNLSLLIEEELPEEWVIIRRQRRRRLATENPDLTMELLTFLGSRDKKMQPLVFRIEPGGKNTEMDFFHRDREDFIYLLKGNVEITSGGNKYQLEKGDAAYFIFENPTTVTNIGVEEAEVLWVISPPGV